ncbi:hypothetical protein SEPCBS119000_006526 [Sporothrix epigloea]|uniref:F-box domain-containing protein n=1 Tax=Sporothrix epigloea TaxID=1892477 RepID=A0ABP0E3Y4_9PEZI
MSFAWHGGDDAVVEHAAVVADQTAVTNTHTVATTRKEYLLGLVPDLTLDEIWMLQERIAKLDLRTDIFARLPPELQLIVCEYLGPVDLGCCLHVSRLWRASFLHESVRKGMAQRCFPSLLEYVGAVRTKMARLSRENADADDQEASRSSVCDPTDAMVTETARKYALRSFGRFCCVFRHCCAPALKVAQTALATTGAGGAAENLTWLDQGRPIARRQRKRRSRAAEINMGSSRYVHKLFTDVPGFSFEMDAGTESDEDYDAEGFCPYFHGPEYAYGHIAWQCLHKGATWFLVDDLRTGRRRPLCVPNDSRRGESYLMVGLGDELLIATCGSSMLAWNFTTGEQQRKRLPAAMETAQTLGNRVCILAGGRVYVWTFGGMLQEADITGLDKMHLEPDVDGRIPGFFILDPVNDGVFYRGNYELDVGQRGRHGVIVFHLHMFEDLKYSRTFSERLDFRNSAFPRCLIESTVRRNARGLYSLASWRIGPGAPGPLRAIAGKEVDGVASIAFNIYTKTFSLSFFRLPPPLPSYGPEDEALRSIRAHIWNDQLLTVVERCDDAAKCRVQLAQPLLFAFEDEYSESACCSAVLPFSAVPLYTSSFRDEDIALCREQGAGDASSAKRSTNLLPEARQKVRFDELCPYSQPGRWLQDEAQWDKHKCRSRFALDLDATPFGPGRAGYIRSHHIQGDDDFLVFRHDTQYTVWSFCDDIIAPHAARRC